jgi:hypothetical protein
MSDSVVKRIEGQSWRSIEEIARKEGREPRNVLDNVIRAGLTARAMGVWPTPVRSESAAGQPMREPD